MAYIGNDILSLNLNENIKSYSNPDYCKRILHYEEKENFLYSVSNTAMYWSIKESAYKVLMKKGINVSFSPALYKISIDNSDRFFYYGNVIYKNYKCFFKSLINTQYCVSICSDNLNIINRNNYQISFSNEYDKSDYYRLLYNDIGTKLNLNNEKLSLQKDLNGIPYILFNQEILNVDISLSHDGDFFSYVWITDL